MTQQEFTSRPSTMTLQAPQLPLLQPSLAPVRRSSSRSTSSKLCRGSHRNSVSVPLIVEWTWIFFMDLLQKSKSQASNHKQIQRTNDTRVLSFIRARNCRLQRSLGQYSDKVA